MITALQTQPLASNSVIPAPIHAQQPASGLADILRRWWQALQAETEAEPMTRCPAPSASARPRPVAVPDWQIPAYLRKAQSGDTAGVWVCKRP